MTATARKMYTRPQKPADMEIKPHRMDFEFDPSVPRYWFDNDPFMTHFMNALSLLFPEGERFFVDAVRHYRDRIKDDQRQQEISGFIGQEAMHSREHASFNAFLQAHGYPADRLEEMLAQDLANARRELPPKAQLAVTVALEHITAILAEMLMEDADVRENIHGKVRNLWLWHAVEETEHKAVAWDLYQDVGGTYLGRVGAMIRASLLLTLTTTRYHYQLLDQDGLARRPSVWAKGLWRLWGRRGYLSRLAPAYLTYFRPDFHPWKIDNGNLAKTWKRKIPGLA